MNFKYFLNFISNISNVIQCSLIKNNFRIVVLVMRKCIVFFSPMYYLNHCHQNTMTASDILQEHSRCYLIHENVSKKVAEKIFSKKLHKLNL